MGSSFSPYAALVLPTLVFALSTQSIKPNTKKMAMMVTVHVTQNSADVVLPHIESLTQALFLWLRRAILVTTSSCFSKENVEILIDVVMCFNRILTHLGTSSISVGHEFLTELLQLFESIHITISRSNDQLDLSPSSISNADQSFSLSPAYREIPFQALSAEQLSMLDELRAQILDSYSMLVIHLGVEVGAGLEEYVFACVCALLCEELSPQMMKALRGRQKHSAQLLGSFDSSAALFSFSPAPAESDLSDPDSETVLDILAQLSVADMDSLPLVTLRPAIGCLGDLFMMMGSRFIPRLTPFVPLIAQAALSQDFVLQENVCYLLREAAVVSDAHSLYPLVSVCVPGLLQCLRSMAEVTRQKASICMAQCALTLGSHFAVLLENQELISTWLEVFPVGQASLYSFADPKECVQDNMDLCESFLSVLTISDASCLPSHMEHFCTTLLHRLPTIVRITHQFASHSPSSSMPQPTSDQLNQSVTDTDRAGWAQLFRKSMDVLRTMVARAGAQSFLMMYSTLSEHDRAALQPLLMPSPPPMPANSN
eukprot:TRINITY_DN2704_c0_g2_i5.p1 TRINITY_DN2704_c0_g2~~TRINITY_DN2704_c0_g2_i5.p1  ORF type:complete len:576 (-),score=116.23 TRINITY_DN2704_c0_g2_i5:59-1684(-)